MYISLLCRFSVTFVGRIYKRGCQFQEPHRFDPRDAGLGQKIISFIMNQHIYIHSHWYGFSYITYIILILDKLLSIYLFVYMYIYIYISGTFINLHCSFCCLQPLIHPHAASGVTMGHLGVLLLVVAICIASYGIRRFRPRSNKNGKHHDTRKYQEHKLQKWFQHWKWIWKAKRLQNLKLKSYSTSLQILLIGHGVPYAEETGWCLFPFRTSMSKSTWLVLRHYRASIASPSLQWWKKPSGIVTSIIQGPVSAAGHINSKPSNITCISTIKQ